MAAQADIPPTLLGLLERYSPSGSEKQAAEWLVARMRELGYARAFVDPAGNAVGILGAGERQIVLLGHIDTVPGEIPIRLEGEALYGRGAVDAKGPLAAFVDSAAQAGAKAGWQVVVIGAVDEERNSSGARQAIKEFQPSFAIIGEPSGWDRCTLGYKGIAIADLTLRRPQAHSASGNGNAPEAAFALWGRIREWAEGYNRERARPFDQILVSLRGFSSGESDFEGWARLRVAARLPLDCPPGSWYQRLGQLAPETKVEECGFPIPAYLGEKNTSLVHAVLAGIRAQGGQPRFVLKTGTADLNLAAPAWGCPAVAYGPGDSNLDHTPNEHILMGDYRYSVDVLQGVLERLMGGRS